MSDAFTAVAPAYADEPAERRPGDFQRSKTGTPYVSDPTGACVKPKRKSDPPRVKRLAYGRPSSFGKQIEDTYNLSKWSERTVALGIGVAASAGDTSLVDGCVTLAGRDRDTTEWRADADGVVVEAKRVAKGGIAAERGTHAHQLTEEDDQERDWIVLAERGEVLGLDGDVQASLVAAWREMLATQGLEILATEAPVVHDGYRMAGTLDRVARLTRPLRFAIVTGETVELPAGTVLVLDIKTGKRRVDGKGVVMYWASYAVQICTYAGGVPYDVDTDERGVWPWPIDQRWALIAHLDVLGAIDGRPACTLVLVDLAAGRHAADLCAAAKEWEKRTDVFSVAALDEIAAPTVPTAVEQQAEDTGAASSADIAAAGEASPEPPAAAPSRRDWLRARCRAVAEASPSTAAVMAAEWPEDLPALSAEYVFSDAEFDRLSAFIERFETAAGAAFSTPDPGVATIDTQRPDEGEVVEATDLGFTIMQQLYGALDDAGLAWMSQVVGESIRAGRSIHMSSMRTVRRVNIVKGLVLLAGAQVEGFARDLTRIATGADAVLFTNVPVGAAVSTMGAAEAVAFADLCARYVGQPDAFGFADGYLALRDAA